jgi:hypothetical protein
MIIVSRVPMSQLEKPRRKAPRRSSRRTAVDASEAAAWERACNEVIASILSDRLRKVGKVDMDPSIVQHGIRARLDEAKIELGEHEIGDGGCFCRHHALITVGASSQSRLTGVAPGVFFDAQRAVLESYLARRN